MEKYILILHGFSHEKTKRKIIVSQSLYGSVFNVKKMSFPNSVHSFFCLLFVGQKECKLMGLIKFSRKKILHSKFIIVTLHSEMDDWCWRLVAIKAIFHHPISAATHSAKL
jgi:hypothetical protein